MKGIGAPTRRGRRCPGLVSPDGASRTVSARSGARCGPPFWFVSTTWKRWPSTSVKVGDHLQQRLLAGRQIPAQEEFENRRLWELGSASPAAMSSIERARRSTNGRIERTVVGRSTRYARRWSALRERRGQPAAVTDNLVALRLPQLGGALEQLGG